jgi:hypothetical protein
MDWNELRPVIEICSPILGALAFIYFRLEKRRKEDQRDWALRRKEDQELWFWLFDWAHKEIEELKRNSTR